MDSNSTTIPRFHADLTMTPEVYAELSREQGALEVAQAYTIDSPDMAVECNNELRSIKARLTRIKEIRKGFVEPARQIIANAEALFDPAIKSLESAEGFLKGQLTAWDAEQRRLADEARRQRDAEERKARQEAEAKAAAFRAKAEEEAKEQRRIAQEAERRRAEAEAEGRAKDAAKAAAEAAAAASKADSVIENAEAKAQGAVIEAQAAVAPAAPAPQKLAGFSARDNWVAELDARATEERAVAAIAAAIAGGRTELVQMLKLDWPALNKTAKAFKASANIPCIVSVNRPVATSRRA